MNDVLAKIVEATRAELDEEIVDWRSLNRAARLRAGQRDKYAFYAALKGRGAVEGSARIIAEIKAASPSAGTIVENPDVEAIAASYRQGGAAAISVVTEPRFFLGQRAWIYRAWSASSLPVLMKDFVISPVQIYKGVAAGADAVLLLASILEPPQIREMISILDEMGRDALVEIHDDAELDKAVEGGARIIGVNSRDLRTFNVDLAVAERLAQRIPKGALGVAESGIRSRSDVERLQTAGFDAFLVGESLLRADDREAAVRELVGNVHET